MKAIIDQKWCVACGLCADICPEVFCMTDNDTVAKVCGGVTKSNLKDAEEAEDHCPVSVITIEKY